MNFMVSGGQKYNVYSSHENMNHVMSLEASSRVRKIDFLVKKSSFIFPKVHLNSHVS